MGTLGLSHNTMEYLQRIREIAWRLEAEVFAKARPGYYLLGAYPSSPASPIAQKQQKSFTTSPAMSVDEIMAIVKAVDEPVLTGRFLRKLEKSDRNPWLGRISVGRTGNNDVVIIHPSISKLHAHFFVDPAESRLVAPQIRLADAGSRNGTLLNDQEVRDAPKDVCCGDQILFGEVACLVLDAATLHQTIRTQFPPQE
jgi:hypothetical protein